MSERKGKPYRFFFFLVKQHLEHSRPMNPKDAGKWKLFASQDFRGWSENQGFTYVIPQPSVGLLGVYISVSKRRSICWYFSFRLGNKIGLYQFPYRLLRQGPNFNYTDICRQQCPSLLPKDAGISYLFLPIATSFRNLSPAYGQRQPFDRVSNKNIWRTESNHAQRHLWSTLGEPGSQGGFEHQEINNLWYETRQE